MDKAKLLANRAGGTQDVEIPGVGTVKVRALTRAEVKACKGKDDLTQENQLIAAGMVDPVLTPDEVSEWLDNAPAGEAVAVIEAIRDLSGLGEGAQKSGVPRARRPRKR